MLLVWQTLLLYPFKKLIHERINEEQVKCDKADGKVDGTIKVSGNEEINLQVTDAVIRKINELQNYIESDPKLQRIMKRYDS